MMPHWYQFSVWGGMKYEVTTNGPNTHANKPFCQVPLMYHHHHHHLCDQKVEVKEKCTPSSADATCRLLYTFTFMNMLRQDMGDSCHHGVQSLKFIYTFIYFIKLRVDFIPDRSCNIHWPSKVQPCWTWWKVFKKIQYFRTSHECDLFFFVSYHAS